MSFTLCAVPLYQCAIPLINSIANYAGEIALVGLLLGKRALVDNWSRYNTLVYFYIMQVSLELSHMCSIEAEGRNMRRR